MEVRYQLRYSPVNRIVRSGGPEQHTGCTHLFAPTSPALARRVKVSGITSRAQLRRALTGA